MMKQFLFVALVLILTPSISYAADGSLYLWPARDIHAIGDIFEVAVRANTDGVSANAAEADIAFNTNALAVESISTTGSVLSFWPTAATFSNDKGTIRFSGTAAGSFNSDAATLVSIKFRAKSNVPGDVHIDSGALLLNDARATNIIASMHSGLYTVTARALPPAAESIPLAATTTEATAPVPEVKGVAIQVPTIKAYDDHILSGERIALQGTAAPSSKLSVFLQYGDDAPRESAVLSTSDGTFIYVSAEPAHRGVYHAWAVVQTARNQLSSDKIVISAQSRGLSAAGESIGPILTRALPYVVLLIGAVLLLGYFYNRKSRAGVTGASV